MEQPDFEYKIAFASIRGMGIELAQKILDIIPSEREFFDTDERELRQLLQTKNKMTENGYRRDLLSMAKREMEFIAKNNIGCTYFSEEDKFPFRLSNAPDAPIILFFKGDIDCLSASKVVSMVGTRHSTTYGQHFCDTFVHDMADTLIDTAIVSGLAYGIDIASHRAALSNDIPTIAVLAHGLNTIYPSQHRNDAIKILEKGGLLLTDYTSQAAMSRGNFLARNRIIAGLSDCTIVVESALKGGAMTTANIASSYDRDVFAVPGKTSDIYSEGCNKLIKDNKAALITCCKDLAKAMRWETLYSDTVSRQKTLFPEMTAEEQSIFDFLQTHPDSHINIISNALGMSMPVLLNAIIDMEFKGLVLSSPGNRYSIA